MSLPTTSPHEVLRVIADRVAAGSRPGHQRDPYRVALAIEGGGMRGVIAAGMALGLHEAGALPAFDAVYGASAGALSAAWLLSSRPEGVRGWTDPVYATAFIRRANVLRGRAVVDVEKLVEQIYVTEFPLDFASILRNPVTFHPLATEVATGRSVDLHDQLREPADVRLALRASAALPVLTGPPVAINGRLYYDAGLAESIPYRTALAQQATHVLVLRSRRAVDPVRPPSRLGRFLLAAALRRHPAPLRTVALARHLRLADDELALAEAPTAMMAIRPADDCPAISRLESDVQVLASGFEAGRRAVLDVLGPHLRA